MSSKLNCPFCTDDRTLPYKQHDIREHLVATIDKTNHVHIHGPIKNLNVMKQFIVSIAKEAGIEIRDRDAGDEESKIKEPEESSEQADPRPEDADKETEEEESSEQASSGPKGTDLDQD